MTKHHTDIWPCKYRSTTKKKQLMPLFSFFSDQLMYARIRREPVFWTASCLTAHHAPDRLPSTHRRDLMPPVFNALPNQTLPSAKFFLQFDVKCRYLIAGSTVSYHPLDVSQGQPRISQAETMIIKPNDAIVLIMLLVSVCAALATILLRRHLRPGRFISGDSATISYYPNYSEESNTSSPQLVDPNHVDPAPHNLERFDFGRLLRSLENDVDGTQGNEDHVYESVHSASRSGLASLAVEEGLYHAAHTRDLSEEAES